MSEATRRNLMTMLNSAQRLRDHLSLHPEAPDGTVVEVRIGDLRAFAEQGLPGKGPLTLDTSRQVFFYEQDHYYLSNFSAFRVKFNHMIFDTAEAAYHYQRFHPGTDHRAVIITALSAHDAYTYAQKHKADQVKDWDDIKVPTMKAILLAKAHMHEYVRRKLLLTGERELVENSWRDPFWGWGPERDGKNMLGKCWMQVRAELREKVAA